MRITKTTSAGNLVKSVFVTLMVTDANECVTNLVKNVKYQFPKNFHVDMYNKFPVQHNHINLNAWQNVKVVFPVVTCARIYVENGTLSYVNIQ